VLQDFIIPSILMGLGIAVDVAIATVVRFRDSTMTFRSWTAPVALAHVLLPAAGYYLWWILGSAAPALSLPLGLLAFTLISLFLLEAFYEWIGSKPPFALSDFAAGALAGSGRATDHRSGMLAIMAVSMDALWSGPAKAAQVSSGNWGTTEVLLSFVIAGVVVAVVAEAALILANLLRRIKIRDLTKMSVALVLGKFAEMAVLGAFGLLALWNAFSPWIGLGSLFKCLGLAAILAMLLWLVHWNALMKQQRAELCAEMDSPGQGG